MLKRGWGFILIFILLLGLISASWFSDFFSKNKINGNAINDNSCIFENPKDFAGNYILVSNYYYGENYTNYAGGYCEKVKNCTGFKNVVIKDDNVKACRCDNFWGCPYNGTKGPSCVENVFSTSFWERVGSLTCTGCSEGVCGDNGDYCGDGICQSSETSSSCPVDCEQTCIPNCAGKQCGSDGCSGTCGTCSGGQTCNSTGQCAVSCINNSYSQCSNNDVYWYDSCRVRGDIKSDCNSTQICLNDTCVMIPSSINSCIFENPKDFAGNYILVSNYYYGENYTNYAGGYCEKVKNCTGFKNVVIKDDNVKACRCDNFWGCPYNGTKGPSCVENVFSTSFWERVGSLTCTGCSANACEEIIYQNCTDTDRGLNYYVKGNLIDKVHNANYEDGCSGNITLKEYWCGAEGYQYEYYNCSNGCANGACIMNLLISVATLKDNYLAGEQINLTDPPEEEVLIAGLNDEDFVGVEEGEGITSSVYKNYFFGENIPEAGPADFSEEKFNGYIIQFEKEPVIVEKKRLDETARGNEKYVLERAVYNPVRIYKQLFSIMPEDVGRRVDDYSESLKDENEKIKRQIAVLEKRGRITGNAVSERDSLKIENEFKNTFNGIYLNISEKEAKEISKVSGVKGIYPNYEVYAVLNDSVPLINADDVWQIDEDGGNCSVSGKECLTGKGVTIAILDTGVDYTHKDLGNCSETQFLSGECSKVLGGYDFFNKDNNPADDSGHGTYCASIAAGNGALKGVAPDAKLYAFKILDSNNKGYASHVLSGLERTIDLDNDGRIMEDENDSVDIISMSFGGSGNPDDAMSKAVDNVVNAGIVAIASAGNDGPYEETIGSPGTSRKAITVGASDKSNKITSFSSRGGVIWEDSDGNEQALIKPDVVAPGVEICAAQYDSAWNDKKCLDDEHISLFGTSVATPHVAGAVALIKQAHPDWNPEEIKSALKNTAINIREKPIVQGAGRIDVLGAVKLENPPEEFWDFGITGPLNLMHNSYDILKLKGVFPEDFDSLELMYSKDGIEWSNRGVSIIGENYVIAEIDPAYLSKNAEYEFNITIFKGGIVKSDSRKYLFDSALKKGYPIIFEGGYMNFPVLEDLDGDLIDELIVSTYPNFEGGIYVFKEDSELMKGWPRKFSFNTTNPPIGYPSVGDLNGDGFKEIVAVSGFSGAGNFLGDIKSFVYAFDLHGNILEGFPVEIELSKPNLNSAIADLNQDKEPEIIVATGAIVENISIREIKNNKEIYVISNKGEIIKNWPVKTSQDLNPFIGPTITDLDRDGNLEILVGTKNYTNIHGNASIEAFYFNGSVVSGFPKSVLGEVSRMIAGDINSDGIAEFFVNHNLFSNSSLSVFSYNDSVENYCTINKLTRTSIADINLDSKKEIISVSANSLGIMDSLCNYLPGWPKYISKNWIVTQPIVADIEGDFFKEIIIMTQAGMYAYDSNGVLLENFPRNLDGLEVNLVVGNFDSDPYSELVATSQINLQKGFIYAFDFEGLRSETSTEWPMFQHDAQHTGNYDFNNGTFNNSYERTQSKIVNNENISMNGNLLMELQKKLNNNWADEMVVTNQSVVIPANGLIKLDIGGDYGWNLKKVKAAASGDYRIYVLFESNGQKFETDWEFKVK